VTHAGLVEGRPRWRPDLRTVIGLVVSGVLLWWVFRDADLATIGRQLADADPGMLVATGVIATTGGLIRAFRWRLLLEPVGARTTLRARWAALNIGFMVTNLFPARLGEVARPFALSRMTRASMSAALGTVVLERVLDAVAIVVLTLVTMLSPAFPAGATVFGRPVGFTLLVAGLVAGGLLAVVFAAAYRPAGIVRVVHGLASHLHAEWGHRAARGLEVLLSGLRLLRRPAPLAGALLWSLLLWLWMAAGFWTAFRAFGLNLGFTAAMFTECALSLFEALPAAPGFLGTMQAGVLASVHGIFGLGIDPTLSMAVGYYLAGFIPVTLLGLYYAWRTDLRLRSVGRLANRRGELETGSGTSPGPS
jgi:uncharacterized protein (TIRG00374 family)